MDLQHADSTPRAARPRGLLRAVIVGSMAILFVGAAVGFIAFLSQLRGVEIKPARNADGIVVLTGGSSRVSDAMELLAGGYGKRLLISGVHPTNAVSDISRSLPDNQSLLLRCCVDLDRSAVNTRSNAAETRRWVRERGFKSLIVVTSNYHMPRSLLEMGRLLKAAELRPYVADTSLLVDRALRDGHRVLLEGAQGTLLDLDHGTYPFVTSSSPIAAGAAVSFGIGPNRIDEVLGVAKAYVTRVGEGPFPSEILGPDHERVQVLGQEFGTVTGRERRCGWLDLVALRFAVRVNGITSLALTKLDVLSEFDQLPVCVRYRLPDESETEDFPSHQSDFHHCRPVFEVLPGWGAPIDDELPEAARSYVSFVEKALGVPVTLVGTGAEREHVLAL